MNKKHSTVTTLDTPIFYTINRSNTLAVTHIKFAFEFGLSNNFHRLLSFVIVLLQAPDAFDKHTYLLQCCAMYVMLLLNKIFIRFLCQLN